MSLSHIYVHTIDQHKIYSNLINRNCYSEGDIVGKGFLKVQLYSGDYTLRGEPATVLIKKNGDVIKTLETDRNGTTPVFSVDCPDLENATGLTPRSHFSTVDVVVPATRGYMPVSVFGVQIFDGITSILPVHLQPMAEGEKNEIEIHIPPEHGVDMNSHSMSAESRINVQDMSETDYASFEPIPPRGDIIFVFDPEPIDPQIYAQNARPIDNVSPLDIPFANDVVVPEYIVVHLGEPNSNARNVRIRFRDYIVNVACSEIYPFWHPSAIEANVHAQASFALNRLFTNTH